MRIALTDDLLRCPQNGLDAHPANRATLGGALLPAVRQASAHLEEVSSDATGDHRTSATKLMDALSLAAGRVGWARAWDAQPTPEFVRQIERIYSRFDTIIGWGLSNVTLRALELSGMRYFDVELSPYRFAENFFFAVRTNISELAPVVRAHSVGSATLAAAAGEVSAFHNRRRREHIVDRGARCGVIFGQTTIDAALLSDGRLTTLDQFYDEICSWRRSLDRIFFKQHPHGDGSALKWLQANFEIEVLQRPPYQILSANDLCSVAAISSGTCMEAAAFGIPAKTFIKNPRYTYASSEREYVSCAAVHGACLNRAVAQLVGGGDPEANFAPDYRKIFSSAWGERLARDDDGVTRMRPPAALRGKLPRLAAHTVKWLRDRTA
jgi:hypothetical protein